MWVLEFDVLNEVGKDEPDLRLGGVICVLSRVEEESRSGACLVQMSKFYVSVNCMFVCPERCVFRNWGGGE